MILVNYFPLIWFFTAGVIFCMGIILIIRGLM